MQTRQKPQENLHKARTEMSEELKQKGGRTPGNKHHYFLPPKRAQSLTFKAKSVPSQIFQSEPSRIKYLSLGKPLRYSSSGTTWTVGRGLQNPLLQKANKLSERGEVTVGDGLCREAVISVFEMSV